VDGDEEPEDSR